MIHLLNNLPPNPYIIGIPIREAEKFFGREEVFNLIAENLLQNVQLTLLYGQRRIGKSSVLNLIPTIIPQKISRDEFIFIEFDFQAIGTLPNAEILSRIAHEVLNKLEDLRYLEDEHLLLEHLAENINTDLTIFNGEFLPQVYKQIGEKKIVFLWDEFDVIMGRDDEEEAQIFADYIIQILEKEERLTEPRLFIIPIVGRDINKLETLLKLFRKGLKEQISWLDKDNTTQLITKPAEDILTFHTSAIDAIFNLSAGSPYFTQVICHNIYGQVAHNYNINPQKDILNITHKNVENIIDQAIISAEGGLTWFWQGLNLQQQVIIAAAAEAKKIAIANHKQYNKQYPIEEPLTLLTNDYGIEITNDLTDAYEQLCEYNFLDETKRQVKIEFVHLWLVKEHSLQDTLRNEDNNLQNINKETVNRYLSLANDSRPNDPELAFTLYKAAVSLNPNNFQCVIALAEEYLKRQNINEASNLYRRVYQFYSKTNFHQQELILQPLLNLAQQKLEAKDFEQALEICLMADKIDSEQSKNTLIDVREDYGHNLILKREWARAEEQFTLVLQLDSTRRHSKQRLEEIKTLKTGANLILKTENSASVASVTEDRNRNNINRNHKIVNLLNRVLRFKRVVGLGIMVILGLGGYRLFNTVSEPCRPGENKQFGVRCVVDNSKISRGDRTLFPNISNKFRDQGIQAFKKRNYTQAADLFQKATEANKNDPEVRIYYNNALARQQGYPFTFAVVIPIDSISISNGQEILRGVAAAQQQFNHQFNQQFNQQNQGSNARLLEIVIANDANTNAEQVAQQLTNDASILGVIGHNSSDATKIALPVYEKAGLPIISPTSTSIFLNNSVFFRSVYSDESAGQKLAQYACKEMNLQKVVIFANPNSPYSNSIREVFTNTFEKLVTSNQKLPCQVVGERLIDFTATDFDPEKEVARSVYTHKAEAALLVPNTDKVDIAVNIAKEITKRNTKLKSRNYPIQEVKMLAGDTLYNHDLTIVRGGKDIEGLVVAIPWFRGTSAAKEFAEKSRQLWGGDVSWRTATSFDATQAFIKALSNNASRTTVLEKLKNVNLAAKETSGYPFQFTEKRERQGESILLEVKDGQFIEIKSKFNQAD